MNCRREKLVFYYFTYFVFNFWQKLIGESTLGIPSSSSGETEISASGIRCYLYSCPHCLYRLFCRQNLLCDVRLVADDVEIDAHKMVLASCSPYFYAMFTSFEESKQDRIVLKGVDPVALQIIVDYIYLAEVLVTEENVQVSSSDFKFFLHLRSSINSLLFFYSPGSKS